MPVSEAIDGLLPAKGEIVLQDVPFATPPSKTYRMHADIERISGMTDDEQALEQAIYKIIHTQRYAFPIYSQDYGIEIEDLFGKPTSYVEVELERRITEALEWDDRIERVDSFSFSYPKDKKSIYVSFTAHTVFGQIEEGVNYDI